MGSKKQRLNNVYGSKVAARQDLMQMLLPTLGAAFLFFGTGVFDFCRAAHCVL